MRSKTSFFLLLIALIIVLGLLKAYKIETFTDIDGNVYSTVKIGDQIWMAENLRVLNNPDGNPVTSYCYRENENNCQKYGRLYPWKSALEACPKGWHLPTREECQILIDFLGGEKVAGGKLKAGGESEFNAFFTGGRAYKGTFDSIEVYGSFWCSDAKSEEKAWHFSVHSKDNESDWFAGHKDRSVSVRYIKNK